MSIQTIHIAFELKFKNGIKERLGQTRVKLILSNFHYEFWNMST